MDETPTDVGSTPVPGAPVEGWMLREDVVREVLARLGRGEPVKTIARELGVDKKTIKRWRQRGAWRARAPRVYAKAIDAHRPFLERRGPEVGWNGAVLLRELRTVGFTGGYQQVQRALQPLRTKRHWAARATVRFETGPGEQAHVDFGQLQVWIARAWAPWAPALHGERASTRLYRYGMSAPPRALPRSGLRIGVSGTANRRWPRAASCGRP